MGESKLIGLWDYPFSEFSVVEQLNWKASAFAWYTQHRSHVEGLIREANTSYEPFGSDCGKPELWKGSHWRWYWKVGNK